MISVELGSAVRGAHRPNLLAKKSFSIGFAFVGVSGRIGIVVAGGLQRAQGYSAVRIVSLAGHIGCAADADIRVLPLGVMRSVGRRHHPAFGRSVAERLVDQNVLLVPVDLPCGRAPRPAVAAHLARGEQVVAGEKCQRRCEQENFGRSSVFQSRSGGQFLGAIDAPSRRIALLNEIPINGPNDPAANIN